MPVALTSGGACVLELTFVDTAAEVVETSDAHSQGWRWTGLSAMMDVIQVDSAFLSSLGAHLAQGGSLQMSWKSYQTTFYSILASAAQITHSRANSRLNTLFLTFMDNLAAGNSHTSKACNRFFIPNDQELKMRCQVGEQRFPDSLDNDCLPMFYHRLLHAIGAANSVSHSPCLTSGSFGTNGFIACQDFETVPGQASHSGVNTFASQLSVFLEGITGAGQGTGVRAAYLTTYHDVMCEITANGVTVAV